MSNFYQERENSSQFVFNSSEIGKRTGRVFPHVDGKKNYDGFPILGEYPSYFTEICDANRRTKQYSPSEKQFHSFKNDMDIEQEHQFANERELQIPECKCEYFHISPVDKIDNPSVGFSTFKHLTSIIAKIDSQYKQKQFIEEFNTPFFRSSQEKQQQKHELDRSIFMDIENDNCSGWKGLEEIEQKNSSNEHKKEKTIFLPKIQERLKSRFLQRQSSQKNLNEINELGYKKYKNETNGQKAEKVKEVFFFQNGQDRESNPLTSENFLSLIGAQNMKNLEISMEADYDNRQILGRIMIPKKTTLKFTGYTQQLYSLSIQLPKRKHPQGIIYRTQKIKEKLTSKSTLNIRCNTPFQLQNRSKTNEYELLFTLKCGF